jgi:hypothetical protein
MITKPKKYATPEEARQARISQAKEWREKKKREKRINNLLCIPFLKWDRYLNQGE